MCTQSQAIAIMQEVFHACQPILGHDLKEAYLYGSYARGDYHPESDIDIMLTVDLPAEMIPSHRRAVARVTSDLSLKHDITVSVTLKPLAQFVQYADVLPYYQNVIREGFRYAVS